MSIYINVNPSSTEKYRDATANGKPNVSLRHKICACGGRAKAKHLIQYRMCVSCWDKK